MNSQSQAVTSWINQLPEGDSEAAEQLWRHVSLRLEEFARAKLDVQTRRCYDEEDAGNSAFHSLCRGLADGRMEAENRDAFWGLMAVITSRKISAQRRQANRQKRGSGNVSGESAFGSMGINEFPANQFSPDLLAEVTDSCEQLLNAGPDELMR